LGGQEGRPYSSPPLPVGEEGGDGRWVEGGWIRIRFEDVRLLAGRGADCSREGSRLKINTSVPPMKGF